MIDLLWQWAFWNIFNIGVLKMAKKTIVGEREKASQKQLAKDNRSLFQNMRTSAWAKWRKDSQQSYDFACGDQLTEEEEDALKKAGMPTFTVDAISPSVRIIKYFTTANNPRFWTVGAEASDDKIASVHRAVQDHCFHRSNFKSVFGQVVSDTLKKSLGYFFVYVDKNADYGRGEVAFNYVDPWTVYPDPASTDILFRDAAYILVKKNFTRKRLMLMLPEFADIIKEASGTDEHSENYSVRDSDTSITIQQADIGNLVDDKGTSVEMIDYYERYYKKRILNWYIAIVDKPTKEELAELQKRVAAEMEIWVKNVKRDFQNKVITLNDKLAKEEISEERMKFEIQKMEEDLKQAAEQQNQKLMSEGVALLQKRTTAIVSDADYQKMKDSKEYKDRIVEATSYWDASICVIVSIGSEMFLYEADLGITEYPFVSVPYEYTGTPYPYAGVRSVIGRQQETNKAHQLMIHNASLGGSLRWMYETGAIDRKKWETEVSIPGGLLEAYDITKIQAMFPAPLSTAFYEIADRGERGIQETMGVSPLSMGLVKDQSMPYRGMLAQDEFSTRGVRAWVTNILEPALEQLGRVFTQYAQKVYTAHKVIRIVEPDTGEMQTHELNVPIYDSFGNTIGKFNDYASAQIDLRIMSGATLPINKHAEYEKKKEMFQLGLIDDIAMLAATDIPDKQAILDRHSMMSRLQQYVDALESQVKDRDGTIETLKRQVIQAGMKVEIKDADAELRKVILQHKQELAEMRAKMKLNAERLFTRAEAKNKEKEENV